MSDFPITDSDIQALVDGELPPAQRERIRQAMEQAPHLYERYLNLRQQKALLLTWWDAEGDTPV